MNFTLYELRGVTGHIELYFSSGRFAPRRVGVITSYSIHYTKLYEIYKLNENGEVAEKRPGSWEKALWVWHDVNNHWNYTESESVVAEVISTCPELELFLNGKSLGKKSLADFPDRIYKWLVPFETGVLEVSYNFV